jgi:Flp pilus assembly protein TadG
MKTLNHNVARPRRPVRRRGERGFSLIMLAISASVMAAFLGLGFDLGRGFIVKNELQTFVDASALAAITQLDGTLLGVQSANSLATAGPLGTTKPNGYNFATMAISQVAVTYASSYAGTYDSYATAILGVTNSYRFVKVTAQASVSLSFLPVLPGISTTLPLTATAIAGQQAQSSVWNGGLVPFAPDSHTPSDPKNFGFIPGVSYSLKWGNGNTTTCAGDLGFSPNLAPSGHGFVDLGQGNANSNLRHAIEYGGYPNPNSTPSSVSAGTVLGGVSGNRGSSIFTVLGERSDQDTDQVSLTWAEYKVAGLGNGRRIVTVPVVDPSTWSGNGSNAHATVIGFGNFLLDPGLLISGSSGPICASYIGPGNLNGNASGGANGAKVYSNMLYQ